MKNLLTLGSMASALFLGWNHHDMTDTKVSADSKSAELLRQIEAARHELQIANARIAQLTGRAPQASSNWIAERNRNWESSLNRGAYDRHQAFSGGGGAVYYATGETGGTTNNFSYSQNSVRNAVIVNPSSANRMPHPESSAFKRVERHDAPTSSLNRDSDSRGRSGNVAPQAPQTARTQPTTRTQPSVPVRNSTMPPPRTSPSSGGN